MVLVGPDLVGKYASKHVLNVVPVVDKVPFLLLLVAPLLISSLLLCESLYFLHFHLVKQSLHVSQVRILDLKVLLVLVEFLRIIRVII